MNLSQGRSRHLSDFSLHEYLLGTPELWACALGGDDVGHESVNFSSRLLFPTEREVCGDQHCMHMGTEFMQCWGEEASVHVRGWAVPTPEWAKDLFINSRRKEPRTGTYVSQNQEVGRVSAEQTGVVPPSVLRGRQETGMPLPGGKREREERESTGTSTLPPPASQLPPPLICPANVFD